MTRADLLEFMRRKKLVVQASTAEGEPQAAVVGIVVTDSFEVFFDTLDTTRKARNLRRNPKIAFVMGGTGPRAEQTVQFTGIADEPVGVELTLLKQLYFARFPEGPSRESWTGITYFRARPTWLRYSDYGKDPPVIVELNAADLMNLE